MALTVTELAQEVRDSNRRLADAIDIRGDLRTEVGKINFSLAWIKGIAGFAGLSLVALSGLIYQAGERTGRIEKSIESLQKTTEELRDDFKARDKQVGDAISEAMQKATQGLTAAIKKQGDDLNRLQGSLDRLTEAMSPSRPH